jgi:hypothetical protein
VLQFFPGGGGAWLLSVCRRWICRFCAWRLRTRRSSGRGADLPIGYRPRRPRRAAGRDAAAAGDNGAPAASAAGAGWVPARCRGLGRGPGPRLCRRCCARRRPRRSTSPSARSGGSRCCAPTLDDVHRVRKAHGGTVNDVLLTVVAGGLRRWLADRRHPLDGPLRALVPVSRPHRDPGDTAGNLLSGAVEHRGHLRATARPAADPGRSRVGRGLPGGAARRRAGTRRRGLHLPAHRAHRAACRSGRDARPRPARASPHRRTRPTRRPSSGSVVDCSASRPGRCELESERQ